MRFLLHPSARMAGFSAFALILCGPALIAFAQGPLQPDIQFVAARSQPPELGPAADAGGDTNQFRQLAPGVMREFPTNSAVAETYSYHDLKDLLKEAPNFGERPSSNNLAKDVRFAHDVWALDYSCKPCRFIQVDLPTPSGKFERKNVWYVCYRVQNNTDKPCRFIPRVLLHSWDTNKYYPDRLIPVAVRPIELREDPNRKLLNSVEISAERISPGGQAWGVFTWTDIDPKTDRFCFYIQGLTNAYKWEEQADAGAAERKYLRKTLQINFWRPGDARTDSARAMYYGIPGEVDWQWVYK